MRFLDEFRDPAAVRALAADIAGLVTRPWTVMEICGGQTHAIVRYGLAGLLPAQVRLVHGPGCPVCVTPAAAIDRAVALSLRPEVTVCSFGDMLRVPGSKDSLFTARARGGSVQVVYSPLDALALARNRPDRQIVFFAIGFETTAPATALTVRQANREGLANFSLLVAHVLVPPALEALLASPRNQVQGLLAPGHVCAVAGIAPYEALARRHGVPVAITGFEPVDLLLGLTAVLRRLEADDPGVDIPYSRSVRPSGNPAACAEVEEVFQVATRPWRGLGPIPGGALALRDTYASFDAERRFPPVSSTGEHGPSGSAALPDPTPTDGKGGGQPHAGGSLARADRCRAGEVLLGILSPTDCPAFGRDCTPDSPLGAPMVSAEGACAAYFRYRPAHRAATPGGVTRVPR